MNEGLEKSHKDDVEIEDFFSPFNRLPDEIILQIFNKLIDLKTLCFCYLVCKRFSSIALHVDAISFTAPRLNSPNSDQNSSGDVDGGGFSMKLFRLLVNGVVFKPLQLLRRKVVKPLPPIISSFYGDSFRSAVSFLCKFKGVKRLSIQLPSSCHRGMHNDSLFKWMVKFGCRIESFLFLSPSSIHESKELLSGNDGEELSNDIFKQKVHIAFQCLKDVIVRHRMMLYFVKELPMLEEIAITDSDKRGRLLLRGEKLVEVRDWIDSVSETVRPQLKNIEVPVSVRQCYVPVLDLPLSGYVMKGASLVLMDMNERSGDDYVLEGDDGFGNGEEIAYSEAVTDIMLKHKSRMKRLL